MTSLSYIEYIVLVFALLIYLHSMCVAGSCDSPPSCLLELWLSTYLLEL